MAEERFKSHPGGHTSGVRGEANTFKGIGLEIQLVLPATARLQAKNPVQFDAICRAKLAAQVAAHLANSDLVQPTLTGFAIRIVIHSTDAWQKVVGLVPEDKREV